MVKVLLAAGLVLGVASAASAGFPKIPVTKRAVDAVVADHGRTFLWRCR